MDTFEKARRFVYRNARPLDLARWQYHFEGGSPDAVLNALSAYGNEDGGFGHGIEPDFLNPNSTPIGTWAAADIIHELGLTDSAHPIIQGILRYLDSGADYDSERGQWLNTVPANNDYPHAIWWQYNGESDFRYNPTAALAGFIIRYADKGSALYSKGCDIARRAVQWFTDSVPFEEQHITGCFITLYNCIKATSADIGDMAAFERKLREQVKYNICADKDKWAAEYVPKPSDFRITRDSIFYADNAELAEYECDFIADTQMSDGGYKVTWQWYTDYKEFEVSANIWRATFAVNNMIYLWGHGKNGR